jgi:hypothetical protein
VRIGDVVTDEILHADDGVSSLLHQYSFSLRRTGR